MIQMKDTQDNIVDLVDTLFATSVSHTNDVPEFLPSLISNLQNPFIIESVQNFTYLGREVVVVVLERNLSTELPLEVSLNNAAQFKLLALDGTCDRRGVIFYRDRHTDIIWTVDLRSHNVNKTAHFPAEANSRYALYIRCNSGSVSSFAL